MLENTIAYLRHRPGRSIGFLFSIGSLLPGIWVAALPGIKHRLGFTDGSLGLSLLLAPAGSLTAVMLSSAYFSRVQAGKALMAGCPLQCVAYTVQVASAGFLLAISLPYKGTAIAGFTLVGFGYSCIVPILFSAAANVKGLSPAMGIASIASGGLIGFLLGPAVIGFIAEKSTLASGLSLVLALSLLAIWAAYKNKFPNSSVTS